MNTNAKGVLLVIGAYIVTIMVTILIVTLAIIILMMGSYNCKDMGRALLVLWTTIAVVFVASGIVAGVMTWKAIPSVVGRWAIVVAYAAAMLVSYVIIAFGLMVIFNC
jgi:hypothetical protein